MNKDLEKIIFDEKQIDNIISNVSSKINNDYKNKEPLFIGLLKGAIPFMTDLVKKINLKCFVDYIKVSSYNGSESTGNININGHIPDVKDKDIIIIDDILDTGLTLLNLKTLFKNNGAKSIKIAVLLDKKEGRKYNIEADYIGSICPNEFIVGYGLDYNDKYRNLPYIAILKREVYCK